jgi:uncharacterized protein
MVRVEVIGLRAELAEKERRNLTPEDTTFVMLKDAEGKRTLDIEIGSAEAFAIGSALEGKRWDRPMTHELLWEVIAALGASLQQVTVFDYRGGVYFAQIELTDRDGVPVVVSARPSDALALALRVDAPIFVNEALFAYAA